MDRNQERTALLHTRQKTPSCNKSRVVFISLQAMTFLSMVVFVRHSSQRWEHWSPQEVDSDGNNSLCSAVTILSAFTDDNPFTVHEMQMELTEKKSARFNTLPTVTPPEKRSWDLNSDLCPFTEQWSAVS